LRNKRQKRKKNIPTSIKNHRLCCWWWRWCWWW